MAERRTKTPQERAQEALDVAERKVTRLERDVSLAEGKLLLLKADLEDAVKRRDYLASNPDLPPAEVPGNE